MDGVLQARLDELATLIASSPHNLVSEGERPRLRSAHIPEALALARVVRPLCRPGDRWVDLGTGGGLPGLVLALVEPGITWMLVESVEKKARAAESFAAALGLANVEVYAERAEILAHEPALRGCAKAVVARAVAPLRTLAELARGFVFDGGGLLAVKGPAWRAELAEATDALERCRWQLDRVERLASTPRATWVVTMHARGAPPADLPRRPGVPQRRPL